MISLRLECAVAAPLRLVLDTNVVLDWLLFQDAGTRLLRQGVEERWITVITYPAAIDELRRVLGYAHFDLAPERQAATLELYRAHAIVPELPARPNELERLKLPEGFPRCRDRDDEHFVALTHFARADALVSKDKAVLKLRRRAARLGVTIVNVPQLIEMSRAALIAHASAGR